MGDLIDDIKKYFRDAKLEIVSIAIGLAIAGFAVYYLTSKLYKKIKGSKSR